jgi:menaquinone-dependent protoporphyrinogen oxidase
VGVDLPEHSHPGTNATGPTTLIAYATRAGSTAEVAVFIGERLSERGLAVDVGPVQHLSSLEGYDAVIVGSAIRVGKWQGEEGEGR